MNCAGGRLFGHEVYRSVAELPEAADLAVICTPAATTLDLVRACGERGIAGAVVLAVGFGESGADGARLEARLLDAARLGGVRVVGPNTSGLLNLPGGVNLIGARGVRPGGIALVLQSGNAELRRRGASFVARRRQWRTDGRRPGDSSVAPRRQWHLDGGPPGTAQSHAAIEAARAQQRITLTELEARSLLGKTGLGKTGLEFAPVAVVRSADEAADAAARAACPVAIKLSSRYISHKTDAGGVVLNVRSRDAARAAFESISANATSYGRARGFPAEACEATVSPMLEPPVAELLVGAYRDPQLGPVLTVAAGGIWAEVLRDATHRVLPVDEAEVEAAIGELKVNALLAGARGAPAVRLGPVAEAALAIGDCLMRWPDVAEAEVNPLFVYRRRVAPVDARVVLLDKHGRPILRSL